MSEASEKISPKKTALFIGSEKSRRWLAGLMERMGLVVESIENTEQLKARLGRQPLPDLFLVDFDLLGADYHGALGEFSALGLGAGGRPPALVLTRRSLSPQARQHLQQAGAGAILSHQSGWPDLLFAINRLLFPKTRELRRYNRVFGGFPARIESGGSEEGGAVYNISQEGAFIACDRPPPEGTRLRVIFELPGAESPLDLEARVTWVNAAGPDEDPTVPPGMGVQFLSLDRPELALINQFIDSRER
jgi:uncharacterized protein (TIGR02266 family)